MVAFQGNGEGLEEGRADCMFHRIRGAAGATGGWERPRLAGGAARAREFLVERRERGGIGRQGTHGLGRGQVLLHAALMRFSSLSFCSRACSRLGLR